MTRHVTQMTIFDAGHYTPEEREAVLAGYLPHERDARAKGVPQLGSGRVFPIAEDALRVAAFAIPAHWPQIGGLDFGWDHPTAAVKVAWDRDGDALYVTHAHRLRAATPVIHAAAIKPWGADRAGKQWLPWAWPKDGYQHEKGTGQTLAEAYRTQGLRMLKVHAQFDEASGGGDSVEAGLTELIGFMETERFKVFDHLGDWFEEFRLYHRKEGRLVKERDDLLDATRYAAMMRRHAGMPARAPVLGQAQTRFEIYNQ